MELGLMVFTVAVPGLARRAAGTTAVTTFPKGFPELSVGTVVTRFLPFHWTFVFATKPPPFRVNVKSEQVPEAPETQAGI